MFGRRPQSSYTDTPLVTQTVNRLPRAGRFYEPQLTKRKLLVEFSLHKGELSTTDRPVALHSSSLMIATIQHHFKFQSGVLCLLLNTFYVYAQTIIVYFLLVITRQSSNC